MESKGRRKRKTTKLHEGDEGVPRENGESKGSRNKKKAELTDLKRAVDRGVVNGIANEELVDENKTGFLKLIRSSEVPKDEIHFREPMTGKLLGKIVNVGTGDERIEFPK